MNASDWVIWKYAKQHGYVIVTQDADFNELNSLYGFPPKIIWIRMGNSSTTVVIQALVDYQQEIHNFLNDKGYGCFEILKLKQKH